MKALSLSVVGGQASSASSSGATATSKTTNAPTTTAGTTTATEQATLLSPAAFPEIANRPDGQVWIGLHFPSLSLDVCKFEGGLPAVVIDQSGSRQTVYSACAVAQDHGITPGLSLNAAHALCRNLDVKLRDPVAEYQQLKSYGGQLMCFTPSITLGQWRNAADHATQKRKAKTAVSGPDDNADTLLLEVSSSLRLYAGLEPLLEKVRAEFHGSVSLPPAISVAPCPAAALLMARNNLTQIVQDPQSLRSVLGGLPLYGADLPVTMVEKLMRCGLRTLRDCWRLPRQDLGRRFGADLLHYLDRVCAEQSEPVEHIRAPLCFRQRIELPADTRQHHLIVIAVEKLLAEVQRFLQMHNAAVEKMQFDLWHVNRACESGSYGVRSRTSLTVQTAQADRRPERFLPQLGEQLDRLVMEGEVNAVSVTVNQVLPYARTSADLFEQRDRQQQDFNQLIDVLCARLGQEQVYTLAITPDHRPECAWQRCPLMQQQRKRKTPKPDGDTGQMVEYVVTTLPARPLWLLRQPRPLYCEESAAIERDTQQAERIEAGWWVRADIRRDYAVASAALAENQRGQQRWIYRDLKQLEKPAWYIHGLFG